MTPQRERLHLLLERRVLARQQRLELSSASASVCQVARIELVRRRRCTGKMRGLVIRRRTRRASARAAVGPARAQRAADAAVQLRQRDDGARTAQRFAQRVVVVADDRRSRRSLKSVLRNACASCKCYHRRERY